MNSYTGKNILTIASVRLIAVPLIALLLAACGGGGGGGDDEFSDIPVTVTDYIVDISSQQIVSGSAAPETASETANLRTSAGADIVASGTVTLSGISASAVTINAGYAGEDGALAVNLQSSGANTWQVPANTELGIDDLRRLESTGYYVLVDSPQGQLRGQILPQNWDLVVVGMNGEVMIPPVTSAGSATAGIAVNLVTGAYRARITTVGISNVTGAGIREAFTGARGDVLLGFEQSTSNANVWGTPDINNVNAGGQLSSPSIDKFQHGELHLTVDTLTALDGEVRGQVTPAGVSVFEIELSDAEVVVPGGPPVESPGTATAFVTYGADNQNFALALNTNLVNTSSVFVQQAPSGQNGPILFSLTPDVTVPGNWQLPAAMLTPEQDTALNNQELYISIVTAQFPDGELRGQITLGNSVSAVAASIDENGGTLSLTDPAGVSYSLVLEPGAVVDETLSLTMRRAALPQNLPNGIHPLSAVRLGPDGTSFANAPVITIDDGDAGSGNARVGYMISDDGATIEFTPILGSDLVAAAFPAARHSFEVPHFTLVGVAEIEAAIVFPVPSGASPAETIAKQRLSDHVTFVAQSQLLGAEIDLDATTVTTIMRAWFDSIRMRSSSLSNAGLSDFRKLIEEAVRATEISQIVGLESSESQIGGAFDQNVFGRVRAVLRTLDTACAGGDAASFDRMLKWFTAIDRLYNGSLPIGIDPEPLNCLVTVATEPQGPLAAIEGGENIDVTATVMNPAGTDVTFVAPLGFRWLSEKGINTVDGSTVSLSALEIGLRESIVEFSYFQVDASAAAVIVPNHLGARGVFVTGSAACPDPDDSGARSFDGVVAISSQSVQPISDDVAAVSLQGSGSVAEVTISSISVSANYDANTESRVSGSASGSLSFNLVEVDEETGEPIPVSGSIQLQGTAPNDLFSFPNSTGTDNFGCTLQGRVQIGEVM